MSTTRIILKNTAEIVVIGGDFNTIVEKIKTANLEGRRFVNVALDNANAMVAVEEIAGILVEE
jgi:hypothetical protein